MFTYSVPPVGAQNLRDEPFYRMREQGLLPFAMSAYPQPTLDDWRSVSDPARAWMLRCEDAQGTLCGVGVFTPWRGRAWEFDFTAFRHAFAHAVVMARGAFAWMFAYAPCDSIIGICPAPNRHAWRLAEACGFAVLGRLAGACLWGRTQRAVDGVFCVCTPHNLLRIQ